MNAPAHAATALGSVRARVTKPLRAMWEGDFSYRLAPQVEAYFALPAEAMRRRAFERLRALLVHARDTVPFHARRMREAGFDPAAMRGPEDLAALPPLTRLEVAEHASDLLSSRYHADRLLTFRSGGTTSAPIPFRQTRRAVSRKDAAALVLRRTMGWEPGDRTAWLWGAPHDEPHRARDVVRQVAQGVERLLFQGSLWLPAADLSDAALDAHLERLRRFRADVLQGYPSATDALVRRLEGRPPLRVRLVVLTAEPTLPAQRARIAAALGAEVFTFYGAREVGWIASECRAEHRLHVNTAGVHVEADASGRLLVTDLENLAMPLIRYAVGDRGALDPAPCPCGDARPVLARLEGREADVFTLASGRRVPGLLLDVRGLQWEARGVLEAQLVQTAPSVLEVRWVRAPNHAPGDLDRYRAYLDEVLHGEMAIEFRETERIAPGPNGKVRHTVALPASAVAVARAAGDAGPALPPRAEPAAPAPAAPAYPPPPAPSSAPPARRPRAARARDEGTAFWSLLVKPVAARARGDRSHHYARGVARFLALRGDAARRARLERLRETLAHAKETVPFHRARMEACGLDPAAMTGPEALAALPPLTRTDLAGRARELLSSAYDVEGLVEARSGGTTNAPVPFLQPPSAVAVKDAAALVLRRLMGWRPGHRAAYLWGAPQDAPPSRPGALRRWKAAATHRLVDRMLWLPAGDLSDARLDACAAALRRFRPTALQAYPSAADLLARRLLARGERLAIPIVLLTAEPVFAEQRERVAAAMAADVFTFYGARECGWIAADCAAAKRLHVNTACVHVEAAPDGRLLVTDLVNRAMPLIRYEVGDRGVLDPDPCPCGDPRPVLGALEGRVNDVFVLPSGRRVPGVVADLRSYRIGLGILEAQLVQEDLRSLDVSWVAGPTYREGDERTMRERLDRMFFGELEVRLRRVARLEPSPGGKVRYCVSRVREPA